MILLTDIDEIKLLLRGTVDFKRVGDDTLEIDGKETLDNFVSLCLDCGKVVLIRKSSNEKTD